VISERVRRSRLSGRYRYICRWITRAQFLEPEALGEFEIRIALIRENLDELSNRRQPIQVRRTKRSRRIAWRNLQAKLEELLKKRDMVVSVFQNKAKILCFPRAFVFELQDPYCGHAHGWSKAHCPSSAYVSRRAEPARKTVAAAFHCAMANG
jgi:hypothetical protein